MGFLLSHFWCWKSDRQGITFWLSDKHDFTIVVISVNSFWESLFHVLHFLSLQLFSVVSMHLSLFSQLFLLSFIALHLSVPQCIYHLCFSACINILLQWNLRVQVFLIGIVLFCCTFGSSFWKYARSCPGSDTNRFEIKFLTQLEAWLNDIWIKDLPFVKSGSMICSVVSM